MLKEWSWLVQWMVGCPTLPPFQCALHLGLPILALGFFEELVDCCHGAFILFLGRVNDLLDGQPTLRPLGRVEELFDVCANLLVAVHKGVALDRDAVAIDEELVEVPRDLAREVVLAEPVDGICLGAVTLDIRLLEEDPVARAVLVRELGNGRVGARFLVKEHVGREGQDLKIVGLARLAAHVDEVMVELAKPLVFAFRRASQGRDVHD